MAFDANGNFTLTDGVRSGTNLASKQKADGELIATDNFDALWNDFEQAFDLTFLRDGRTPATGDFDMDGYAIENLKTPVGDADAATKKYIDDALTALTSSLTVSVKNAVEPIGTIKLSWGGSVPANWLAVKGTVGSATSGATYAAADAEDVFLAMWAMPWTTVSGGKGATAAADWAANKPLDISALDGRMIRPNSDTADGTTGGADSHVLVDANMPDHTHNAFIAGTVTSYNALGSGEKAAARLTLGVNEDYQISATTGTPNAGVTSTYGQTSPTAVPTLSRYASCSLIVRYLPEV